MAEEIKKSAIIDLQFDPTDIIRRIAEIKKEQQSLKASTKELQADFDKNSEAITVNGLKLKALAAEEQTLTRVQGNLTTQNKAQTGSLVEMRAKLSNLKQAYSELSEEQRENSKEGKQLLEQTADLNKSIKDIEESYGDHNRSVGDYIKGLNIMGVSVGDASEAFKSGGKGAKVFAKEIFTAKGALVALTAIPIILFLTGLISFIKATDAGADKLEQGINALKTGFTVFTKGLVIFKTYGEGLFSAMIDGAKGLWDILAGIHTGDLDRVKNGFQKTAQAFSDGKNTIVNTGEAFSNLSAAAYKAAAAQVKLTKATQDLEDAQDDLVEKQALAEAAVSKALLIAKDRNRTEKERLSILAEAGRMQAEASKEDLKYKENAYRLASLNALNEMTERKENFEDLEKMSAAELHLLVKKYAEEGKLNDEQKNAVRDTYLELVKARSAFDDTMQQIENRSGALREQFEAARLAREKKRREDWEKELARRRKNDDMVREGRAGEEAYAKEQLNKRFEAEVKALKRELAIQEDFYQKRLGIISEGEAEANLETLKIRLDGQSSEFALKDHQLKIDLEFLEKRRKAAKDHGKDLVAIDKEITAKRIELKQNEKTNLEQIEQAKFEVLTQSANALNSLLQIGADSASEAVEFQKAIALLQIGIDTAQAISSVVRIATSTSITPIDQAVKIAAGIATVLANIAQAKSLLEEVGDAPRPEFYEGGYTGDGDPKQESKVLGEKPYVYHRREYVIDHKTLETPAGAMMARMAENIRKSRGLSSSGIPGFYDGGFANRTVAQPVQDRQLQAADIIRIVKSIPPQEVNVSKFTKAQAEMKQVRNSLDLKSRRP